MKIKNAKLKNPKDLKGLAGTIAGLILDTVLAKDEEPKETKAPVPEPTPSPRFVYNKPPTKLWKKD